MKYNHPRLLSLAYAFLLATFAVISLGCPSASFAVIPETSSASNQSSNILANLDAKRLYALGMIETGNDDRAIGLAGEISRYQLSPVVWKSYSKSVNYQDPDLAVQVARQHWSYLAAYFKEKTGRVPTDFDMYVLWNTRFGYYAHRAFSKRHLSSIVLDRAERFVNLVNRKLT